MRRNIPNLLLTSLLWSCALPLDNDSTSSGSEDCDKPNTICVRLKNLTEHSFDRFKGDGVPQEVFDLNPGEYTQFWTVKNAYPMMSGTGYVGDLSYFATVIDFIGVPRLQPGRHTFTIKDGIGEDGMAHIPNLGGWLAIHLETTSK